MRSAIAYIPFLIGFIALLIGVRYCTGNSSGHSGVDPAQASLCFTPILAAGVMMLFWKKLRRAGLSTLTVGVFGLFFGTFVEHFQIMRYYEDWVKNGQSADNHSAALLTL